MEFTISTILLLTIDTINLKVIINDMYEAIGSHYLLEVGVSVEGVQESEHGIKYSPVVLLQKQNGTSKLSIQQFGSDSKRYFMGKTCCICKGGE